MEICMSLTVYPTPTILQEFLTDICMDGSPNPEYYTYGNTVMVARQPDKLLEQA